MNLRALEASESVKSKKLCGKTLSMHVYLQTLFRANGAIRSLLAIEWAKQCACDTLLM